MLSTVARPTLFAIPRMISVMAPMQPLASSSSSSQVSTGRTNTVLVVVVIAASADRSNPSQAGEDMRVVCTKRLLRVLSKSACWLPSRTRRPAGSSLQARRSNSVRARMYFKSWSMKCPAESSPVSGMRSRIMFCCWFHDNGRRSYMEVRLCWARMCAVSDAGMNSGREVSRHWRSFRPDWRMM